MLIKIIKIDNIELYKTNHGKLPFNDWLMRLDLKSRYKISALIKRVSLGGSRNHFKYLDKGVFEIKINIGPGYRVYFGIARNNMVILNGGNKGTQKRDIEKAKKYWRSHATIR